MSNGLNKYSKGAIAFHWIIGLLIIANIGLAEYSEIITEGLSGQDARAASKPYMNLHKAFGICVLFLSLARLGWRWTNPRPALSNSISSIEKLLSKIAHILFYVLMIGLPLGGWLWMSTYGQAAAVDMFGLFNMPVLPVQGNEALAEIAHEGHEIGGKIMFVLIILHFLAALKHQFIDKLPFIQRMWP